MALPAAYIKVVSDAIGDAFSTEDLKDIVKAATGNGLYEEYAPESDPRRAAVRKTLDRLILDGNARWLLIRVLAATTNDPLRRLIVKASPTILAPRPTIDQQVDRVLNALAALRTVLLQPDFLPMESSGSTISGISDEIRALAVSKNLHECLHALHIKLAFRSRAAADELTLVDDIETAAAAARQAAEPLREMAAAAAEAATADVATARAAADALNQAAAMEAGWIDALSRQAGALRPLLAGGNPAAGPFEPVERLIRLQMSRLNGSIFETAKDLSLAGLVEVMPLELGTEPSFTELSYALRDLKASVIARALVHKVWQDAENELALIDDVLSASAEMQAFAAHWLALRSRVLWLASLDADEEWTRLAKACSELIETELTRETLGDTLKPSFETLSRVLKFRFLAVDATLKADCSALGRFHVPLESIVAEIRK